jgi:NAD(P)H-hydrate epimerase
MVYYLSVSQNQELTTFLNQNIYAFINIPQSKLFDYLIEADAVLAGPGMVRGNREYTGSQEDFNQTRARLLPALQKAPQKQWIIDAGALQTLELKELSGLKTPILTPHLGEFEQLFKVRISDLSLSAQAQTVVTKAKEHNCIILLKGNTDIIASPTELILNSTGNEGMTKGGTGDVLAGLVAALSCTHPPFASAAIGAYVNGQAGDTLYQSVGPYFSADDLAVQVPKTLWEQAQGHQT